MSKAETHIIHNTYTSPNAGTSTKQKSALDLNNYVTAPTRPHYNLYFAGAADWGKQENNEH